MARVACGILVLDVKRSGYVEVRAEFSGDERARRAINRWLRDWPEHSLNECDHTPFTCAARGEKPCGACAVRAALGLPPLKDMRAGPSENAPTSGKKEEP